MNFIQLLFFTIPLLFLTVTILYAVFKIKEMKRKGNYSNQRTIRNNREALVKNGFKSTAYYDEIRRNLRFPNQREVLGMFDIILFVILVIAIAAFAVQFRLLQNQQKKEKKLTKEEKKSNESCSETQNNVQTL